MTVYLWFWICIYVLFFFLLLKLYKCTLKFIQFMWQCTYRRDRSVLKIIQNKYFSPLQLPCYFLHLSFICLSSVKYAFVSYVDYFGKILDFPALSGFLEEGKERRCCGLMVGWTMEKLGQKRQEMGGHHRPAATFLTWLTLRTVAEQNAPPPRLNDSLQGQPPPSFFHLWGF